MCKIMLRELHNYLTIDNSVGQCRIVECCLWNCVELPSLELNYLRNSVLQSELEWTILPLSELELNCKH